MHSEQSFPRSRKAKTQHCCFVCPTSFTALSCEPMFAILEWSRYSNNKPTRKYSTFILRGYGTCNFVEKNISNKINIQTLHVHIGQQAVLQWNVNCLIKPFFLIFVPRTGLSAIHKCQEKLLFFNFRFQ